MPARRCWRLFQVLPSTKVVSEEQSAGCLSVNTVHEEDLAKNRQTGAASSLSNAVVLIT